MQFAQMKKSEFGVIIYILWGMYSRSFRVYLGIGEEYNASLNNLISKKPSLG